MRKATTKQERRSTGNIISFLSDGKAAALERTAAIVVFE
jgi:hypothetical protein